jgi:1-deoxy-D-xylulose-5-phosphate synthase
MDRYDLVVFAEEGIRSGGFGEYAAELAGRRNCRARVLCLAAEEGFAALGKREELLRDNGLDGEGIAAAALAAFPASGGPAGLSGEVRAAGPAAGPAALPA